MVEGLLINGVDGVSFGGRDLLYVQIIISVDLSSWCEFY